MENLKKILKQVYSDLVNFCRKDKDLGYTFLICGDITVCIYVFLITTIDFKYPMNVKYVKEHREFVLVWLSWMKYSQAILFVYLICPIILNYYGYKYLYISFGLKTILFPKLAWFALKLLRWHWFLVILSFLLHLLYVHSSPDTYIFDIDSFIKEKQNIAFDVLTIAMLAYAAFLISTSFNLFIMILYEFLMKPESKENPGSGYVIWILYITIWYLISIRGIIEQVFYLMLHDKNLVVVFWQAKVNYTAFILLIAALLLIYLFVPSDVLKKNSKN